MNKIITEIERNPIKKKTAIALIVVDCLVFLCSLFASNFFKIILISVGVSAVIDGITWATVGSINKCPHCEEPFGLQKVASRFVGSAQTTMNVQKKVRDRYGRTVASIDDYVPATRNDYINTYKCMYCGGIKESKSSYKTMN